MKRLPLLSILLLVVLLLVGKCGHRTRDQFSPDAVLPYLEDTETQLVTSLFSRDPKLPSVLESDEYQLVTEPYSVYNV